MGRRESGAHRRLPSGASAHRGLGVEELRLTGNAAVADVTPSGGLQGRPGPGPDHAALRRFLLSEPVAARG